MISDHVHVCKDKIVAEASCLNNMLTLNKLL